MWLTALIPFALQMLAIALDEGVFHIRRGLPKWERIGHPLDTLTVLACMGYVLFVPFSTATLLGYIALAAFSTLFVTKDEFVHSEHCPPSEQWLHAVLFTLHPVTLAVAGFAWPVVQRVDVAPWIARWLDDAPRLHSFLYTQAIAMTLFLIYQVVFWNWIWKDKPVLCARQFSPCSVERGKAKSQRSDSNDESIAEGSMDEEEKRFGKAAADRTGRKLSSTKPEVKR